MVPDDAATIQAAIDAGPDTVFVQPGDYDEAPIVRRQVHLVGLGQGVNDRPIIQGLGINDVEELILFRRLVVKDPVVFGTRRPSIRSALRTSAYSCGLTFEGCELRGGVKDSTDYTDTHCVTFSKCRITGNVDIRLRSSCEMESCTVVHGGLKLSSEGGQVVVRDCDFDAQGAFYAILISGQFATLVERTTVRGYEVGISAGGEEGGIVKNNTVEECGTGIRVGIHKSEITGNVVRRCDTGIFSETVNSADISGNHVEHCSSVGMYVNDAGGYRAHVIGNLIHDCGSHGLIVTSRGDAVTDLDVERNTLFRNGGHGLLWDVGAISGSAIVKANISHANVGSGIFGETNLVSTMECNDWSDNQGGNVFGLPTSVMDLSVNPGFCDESADDFHLLATSPLANIGSCGQIGAFGVGCVMTAVSGSILKAERTSTGISIWWTTSVTAADQAWLERSDHGPGGPWSRPITQQSQRDDIRMELDQSVDASREYWYRIVALDEGASVVLGQPVVVAVNPVQFALSPLKPNPSAGPVSIDFVLPSDASIRIDVFDLQGRLVDTPASGLWTAGRHQVSWRGSHAGAYVVRYRYPGGHLDRRLTLVR